jgi:hypothetical protein
MVKIYSISVVLQIFVGACTTTGDYLHSLVPSGCMRERKKKNPLLGIIDVDVA